MSVKFYWSRDPEHAPFRDGLSPTGWDMLWQAKLAKPPNLKCLTLPFTD